MVAPFRNHVTMPDENLCARMFLGGVVVQYGPMESKAKNEV